MDSIAFIAFTRSGRELAQRLASGLREVSGYSGVHMSIHAPERLSDGAVQVFSSLESWTAEHFAADDALVFVGATGIAVRAIAPHVKDKFSDPAVVGIDEAGRFAVPLLSGHVGGANELARALAALSGGQAAVSTATDVNGVFAVDEWAARHGLTVVERELAKEISARLLDGGVVGWSETRTLEETLDELAGVQGVVALGEDGCPSELGFVVGVDESWAPFEKTLHLVPRVVTVGVGCRRGAEPSVLARAVDEALITAGVSPWAVRGLATIDVKRGEAAIEKLADERGWRLRHYSADELRAVPGEFAESPFVEDTVGVGNVCERAACAEGGTLLLGKQAHDGVTVALGICTEPPNRVILSGARSAESKDLPSPNLGTILDCNVGDPSTPLAIARSTQDDTSKASCLPKGASLRPGTLFVVGVGPGGGVDLTGRARAALAASDVLVGYPVYVDLVRDEFPGREVVTTPMRKEAERCQKALELAASGRTVALVCSGDAGVYGLASPVLELAAGYPGVEIEIVPGVTAANGGAALLGAPLGHDWCCLSLSDALTPWEDIEHRLATAAESGLVIALYNPASHHRPDHLRRACDALLARLAPETVCGIVRNIGREGQEGRILTLGELRNTPVDMFTTVFVGTARTREIGGRMVTPRGYRMPSRAGTVEGVERAQHPHILLFGGTTEGRELAEWLDARGRCEVVACCATEYGGELVSGLPHVRPVVGPLDDAAKEALLARYDFTCIVDATHPFASHISGSIARLAESHGIPLLQLAREGVEAPGSVTLAEDALQAARMVAARSGNILLTTGTRDLPTFVREIPDFDERLYVRVLSVAESVSRARELGIPANHIVAAQGPFSKAFNVALIRELHIGVLVTKASGAGSGFEEKVQAAGECGIEAVAIERPDKGGLSAEAVRRELEVRYGA